MDGLEDCRDLLARAISQRRAILFVGAGVSMAVGLPSWKMLVDHLLKELALDHAAIEGLSEAHQMLAEYYRIKHGNIGSLRSWLDRHWSVARGSVAKSAIHRLIVELDFPVIYTTNYDRNLELAFQEHGRAYAKIANAKEIADAPAGVTHIVKYHGDFDDDGSLVLTETDFLDRLTFDSPVDIKFRVDALARTMLFIGYSMSDPNIRLLLHRIWGTWQKSGYEKDRPPSFIFMAHPNPIQEALLARWGITAVTPQRDENAADALASFLGDLRARSQSLEAQKENCRPA